MQMVPGAALKVNMDIMKKQSYAHYMLSPG
jgi:hypothetical protein